MNGPSAHWHFLQVAKFIKRIGFWFLSCLRTCSVTAIIYLYLTVTKIYMLIKYNGCHGFIWPSRVTRLLSITVGMVTTNQIRVDRIIINIPIRPNEIPKDYTNIFHGQRQLPRHITNMESDEPEITTCSNCFCCFYFGPESILWGH